jgi:hypothetical protein
MIRYLSIFVIAALSTAPLIAQPMVTLTAHEGELDIAIDGRSVAEYVWQDDALPRPYFRQLTTPDGIQVSRNYPTDPVADKGNDDHATFHPGAWLAFGDAAGADFWRNKAVVRHLTFLAPPKTGKGSGSFTVINAYDTIGENPKTLFTETCAYTITATKDGYVIIAESEFKPEDADFAFGDQEEMGFGVRLATPLSVKHGGGLIRNSAGGEQEAGTWSKSANWCAGYGKIGERWAGVSVIASPDNFRDAWFHSRDYGLIVANPFGKKAMTGPKDDTVAADSTLVEKDGTFKVGFGVYVFSSEGEPDLPGMYTAYLAARKATVN